MEFLYLLTPTRPAMLTDGQTEAESAAVGRHFAYLQQLEAAGSLILAGRTTENTQHTIGLAIFNAKDEAAARAIMLADPAVVAGVMQAELRPYRVALCCQANIVRAKESAA